MARKTTEQLIEEAKVKGFTLTGEEKYSDLVTLLKEPENEVVEESKEMTVEEALKIVETPGVKCRRDGLHEGSRSGNQLKYYASNPLVRTIIARGASDKNDAVESFCVNDLMIWVIKGKPVTLPQDIVQIYEDADQITHAALEKGSLKNLPSELQ